MILRSLSSASHGSSSFHSLDRVFHLGSHFHHFASLVELFEQSVDFLDGGSATFGDSLSSATIEHFRVASFVGSHGVNDGFDAFEGVVVDVEVFDSFTDSGDHRSEVLEVTHFFDLRDLGKEVVEVELVFSYFFLQSSSFFFVVFTLHTVDEGDDVAHSEDSVGHTGGSEGVDGVEFFACADELYGFVDHGSDGEGCAATSVTVEFGEDNSVEIETVVEFFGCIDGILSCHCVDHEECFSGVYSLFDGFDFVHHFLVDSESACGVDDNEVLVAPFSQIDGVEGYFYGVFAIGLGVNGDLNLFSQHTELFDSSGSVDVASGQQRSFSFFAFELACQFT